MKLPVAGSPAAIVLETLLLHGRMTSAEFRALRPDLQPAALHGCISHYKLRTELVGVYTLPTALRNALIAQANPDSAPPNVPSKSVNNFGPVWNGVLASTGCRRVSL